MPSSRFLEKRDQDPRHCSTIITPQLLTPERCFAQPGEIGPQNQVTGNRVNQDLTLIVGHFVGLSRIGPFVRGMGWLFPA
jgi:hypothetical protein